MDPLPAMHDTHDITLAHYRVIAAFRYTSSKLSGGAGFGRENRSGFLDECLEILELLADLLDQDLGVIEVGGT